MSKWLYAVAGSVVGSAITFLVCKMAFNKKMEEAKQSFEAETQKLLFSLYKIKQDDSAETEEDSNKEDEEKEEGDTVNSEPVNYSEMSEKKKDISEEEVISISPNEFGTEDGYTQEDLILTKDDRLLNEYSEIMDDWSVIGNGLAHMGEYEPDIVYLKNESAQAYYSVERIDETYQDYLISHHVPKNKWDAHVLD